MSQSLQKLPRTECLRQRKGLPDNTREKAGPMFNRSPISLFHINSVTSWKCLLAWGTSHRDLKQLIVKVQKVNSYQLQQPVTYLWSFKIRVITNFLPRARDNPEVIPNQGNAEPSPATEGWKAPNITQHQMVAWPRSQDKKWDVFDEDLHANLKSPLGITIIIQAKKLYK